MDPSWHMYTPRRRPAVYRTPHRRLGSERVERLIDLISLQLVPELAADDAGSDMVDPDRLEILSEPMVMPSIPAPQGALMAKPGMDFLGNAPPVCVLDSPGPGYMNFVACLDRVNDARNRTMT